MNITPIQNNNSNNYTFKRADKSWFNNFKPEKSASSDIIDEIVRNIQKKYNNDPNDITKFCTVTRENGEKIG